jgi:ribose/xylose/arabinose/galactoside ABC-type transport system permease subunit
MLRAKIQQQYFSKIIKARATILLLINALSIVLLYVFIPPFRNITQALYMLKYTGTIGLCALGESFVILAGGGGIDLSIGSILSLSGVMLYFLGKLMPLWFAVLLCIAFGGMLGSVNGVLITRLRLPPFIVTLGTMFLYSGISLGITKGVAYSGFPQSFGVLGNGVIGLVPIQTIVFLLIFAILYCVQLKTPFGIWVMAVGSNEHSARLLGVRPEHVRLAVYIVSGVLAALSGVIMVSWLLTARPDAGAGYELRALAAVVLGGVDLFGGAGSLFAVFLAVILITLFQTGLQLININPVWQLGGLGVLLIVVAMSSVRLSAFKKGGRVWKYFLLGKAG